MMTTEKRYQNAIRKIGGAAGLLCLSDDIKRILKSTMDLEAKTKMLEAIAEKVKR